MGLSTIVTQEQSEDFLSLYISIGLPTMLTIKLYGVYILGTYVFHMSIFYYKPAIEVSIWLQVTT